MKLKIGKIVGSAGQNNWSQVHTYLPEEKDKLDKRGQLLAFINIATSDSLDVVAAGREMISRLHEEYYGSLQSRPLEQLRQSLARVTSEVKGEFQVEIGAVSLVGEVLYLALVGGGKIMLQRQGSTAVVLENNTTEVKFASGYLQPGDVLIFGSQVFFQIAAQGVIQAALSAGLPEAVEALAPSVYGQEKESAAVALIIQAEKVVPEVVIPAPATLPTSVKFPKTHFKINLGFARSFGDRVRPWLKKLMTAKPGGNENSKKTVFTVALVLLVLLAVSLLLGNRLRRRQTNGIQVNTYLDQAKAKKEEGLALLSLNPLKAKENLRQALAILNQAATDQVTDPALEALKQEVEGVLLSVSKEYAVTPESYYDLELMKKDARGGDLTLAGEQLIALDTFNNSAYSIGTADKKVALVAGGEELTGSSQITAFWPKTYVLTVYGIFEADTKVNKQTMIIRTEIQWQEPKDLIGFGGNLYLLDKKGIWQYAATDSGFGTKKAWLKSEHDFTLARSLAIDGSVWVLNSDGTIWKFIRGVRDNLVINGLDQPLSDPKAIFTDADQENLYVLESSRVVVLNKTGEYQAQYRWLNLEATGMVASEKDGKIFLLIGAKIYAFEIKK